MEARKDSSQNYSGEGVAMIKYPVRTAIGAVVVLVLVQGYCSFMTPWIAMLLLVWVLGGSKLT